MDRKNIIVNSMLWSAYGDAFGYITELCDDKKNLVYRTHGLDHVKELIKWRRKVGGIYGVSVDIPRGCYSDDTQLRLAVCRSIMKNGEFDFETFSKIELPVFLAYGLGVGRGTRVAGESLLKKTIQWNTNFFENEYNSYIDGGGNGGAMRIQPHVWAAPFKASTADLIREIMRDVIITHGHPVAWLGAIFHAIILRETLLTGSCPGPSKWIDIVNESRKITSICQNDQLLKDMWIPNLERLSGKSIAIGISQAITDMTNDINTIDQIMSHPSDKNYMPTEETYRNVIMAIDAFNPKVRGSATKTALLATYLAYSFSEDPLKGIELSANALGSDTDTIASMAGAIMGACCQTPPPEKILDFEYIVTEAQRLYDISCEKPVNQFIYPDLLHWSLPKSQIDYVGCLDNSFVIYGLGSLEPQGDVIPQKNVQKSGLLRFFKTSFGQTLLLKYRENPLPVSRQYLPSKNIPSYSKIEKEIIIPMKNDFKPTPSVPKQMSLYSDLDQADQNLNIDQLTDSIIRNGFNEMDIGRQLLRYAGANDGLEKAIAFTAIIVKARRARIKKESK